MRTVFLSCIALLLILAVVQPAESSNVVGTKVILELQSQYHELGDMFGNLAVQYMLDRNYTHLANLEDASIGDVEMQDLGSYLEQSGYGVLLYGAHGSAAGICQ